MFVFSFVSGYAVVGQVTKVKCDPAGGSYTVIDYPTGTQMVAIETASATSTMHGSTVTVARPETTSVESACLNKFSANFFFGWWFLVVLFIFDI